MLFAVGFRLSDVLSQSESHNFYHLVLSKLRPGIGPLHGFSPNMTQEIQSNGNIPDNPGESEKRPERDTWGNGIEFLMSCIAMSVGLGNIWRFPFTAYQNGGGAFLIPYLIVLVLIGRPMYYLEMCLGQFTSFGSVRAFYKLRPAIKGIGYGQMLGSICVATYYCSLVALTFFYLVNSFTSDLPWTHCREEWDEIVKEKGVNCVPSNANVSAVENSMSSSELYFRIEVLKEKDQIDDGLGVPEWRLTLCLLFSYAVLFAITRNGIRSSGKAAYFLAIFPYVIMFALLGRSVSLEGAGEGMLYFINPKWEKLMEAQVWYAAVTQCFFSLNVGFGTITMFASYNSFKQNIYRDCLIVSILDTCTSLLSGTTIFGILGHLAFKLNVDVSEVINAGGTGLAFISYPEAIAKFDAVPWLFAILFFFMLFVLGIGSMVALQGVVITVIMDTFPKAKTWIVSLGTVIVLFLISLVYLTNGGQFIFTLVDFFGGTMIFLILTIFETTMIFWWYGLENFCDDVEFMLRRKLGFYWRICWGIINPVILTAVFIYFLATMERLTHENKDYPDSAIAFGWVIIAIGVLFIPLWWTYYVFHNKNVEVIEAFKKSLSYEKWGPSSSGHLQEWKQYKEDLMMRRKKSNTGSIKRLFCILIGYKYY